MESVSLATSSQVFNPGDTKGLSAHIGFKTVAKKNDLVKLPQKATFRTMYS